VNYSRRESDLADFDSETVELLGKERVVYRAGTGPAVVVLAELPGITPHVLGFAQRIVDMGCTAVVPHLFGKPGVDPGRDGMRSLVADSLVATVPICIGSEFHALATGRTSPVVSWLRELARREHERCGGPGVGAVGMCFTGGFALAMATIPEVVAPVMAQPSLPLPITRSRRHLVDLSDADMALVEQRCAAGDLSVVGLRFCGDRMVPAERFETLRRRLGDAFVAVELPDEAANPESTLSPHSTLTTHLVDQPGEPTGDGLQVVLDHLRRNLLAPS
jgi:dienelactone hydrolase